MLRAALLAVVLFATPAHAQDTRPSRVLKLCWIEDPQCWPMLRGAYHEAHRKWCAGRPETAEPKVVYGYFMYLAPGASAEPADFWQVLAVQALGCT